MKTAAKISFAVALGLLSAWATQSIAQGTAEGAVNPIAPATTAEATVTSSSPAGVAVDVKADVVSGEMESPKVPTSVDNVVKRLNTATEGVSLDELNSAREAVAKLDLLIDIEKRLNDLEKIRREREGGDMMGMGIQLPASALGGASGPLPTAQRGGKNVPPAEAVVERIYGSNGHYLAQIKDGETTLIAASSGDKLSDGSVIRSISRRSVVLSRDGKSTTMKVQNARPD